MPTVDLHNLSELQNLIQTLNPDNIFSAFTYFSWNKFGLNIQYRHDPSLGCLYFDAEFNEEYWVHTNDIFHYELAKDINERHLVLAPLVKEPKNFMIALQTQVDAIMNHSKDCMGVFVDDLTDEQYEQVQKVYETKFIFKTVSNYLYPIQQLQYMAGNKMQKRRNHLNFYLKNYVFKSETKLIHEIKFDDILAFLSVWGDANDKFNYESEMRFVKECKDLIANKTLKGLGLYLDNNLIGLTISYNHGRYCEILVEHANKSIRGSYQYLLSQNLIRNHMNAELVDRQDDVWSPLIDVAKRRYKPSEIIHKNFVLIQSKKSC